MNNKVRATVPAMHAMGADPGSSDARFHRVKPEESLR
jgi:hypothetical protein